MKHKRLISAAVAATLGAALLVCGGVSSQASTYSTTATRPVSYRLLWKQEFTGRSGTKPNSSIFNYDLGGGGWGNNEHQAYTTHNATYTGGGVLAIRAQRVTYQIDDIPEYCPILSNVCEFESARIQTKGKVAFKYGRLEARIRVPAGDGTWPAFWLLGTDILSNAWPNCGEIDIMETKGANPYNVYGTAHGPGYSGGDGIVNSAYSRTALSAGYHVYRIDWLPNSIKWYVDGRLYHTVTPAIVGGHQYVFNKPMFMILNLAMGGWFTGDIDPDLNNAALYVDYVRYYSINGVGAVSGTRNALLAGKP